MDIQRHSTSSADTIHRRMAISVVRDDECRRLTATATGELAFPELLLFLGTVRTGELEQYTLLFDATGATTAISSAEIAALADRVRTIKIQTGLRAPAALVAKADALFGLMRMYETLCENVGVDVIRAFRTVEAASEWLDSQAPPSR